MATAGIFLPAFFFVAVSGPLVPRLRRSAIAGAFLDGLNVASMALMAVVPGSRASGGSRPPQRPPRPGRRGIAFQVPYQFRMAGAGRRVGGMGHPDPESLGTR